MARTALTIVGTVVGAYFGYPQLGMAVGSLVGNAVDPQRIQGPKIGETGAQTSAEGAPRGIVYAVATVTGNVMCCGPLVKGTVEVSGGKGGPVQENEIAIRTFAIRICEGPIAGVLRIWEDNKLVVDNRPGSTIVAETAQWMFGVGIYLGDEDQLPDTFLNSQVPPYDHPAHRGTAYMVVVGRDLTDRRGSLPQYRFEVAGTASLTQEYAALIVHPWIEDSADPRNELNEHTHQYVGWTVPSGGPEQFPGVSGTFRPTLDESIADARTEWDSNSFVDNPPSIGGLFLHGSSANGFTMFPADDSGIDEQERVYMHYNEVLPGGYVAFASYPIAIGSIPVYPDSVWGAASPRAGVWYMGDTYSHAGGQFTSTDRRYSTEIYTNVFDAGREKFATVSAPIAVERLPSPPEGFTKVTGTAKQLAEVEYRSGNLYQNGLGPVLLPGDPDYSNATFWADARTAAITAGTLAADVTSPIVVSEYAFGYSSVIGDPVPLSGIVSDINARCGMTPDQYDVSELDDMVDGLVLAGDYSGGDAITTLRSTYFFDKAEYDKKLWFPKRGKAVVDTLTIDDLTEIPDLSRREQTLEFPKKMHLQFQHAASGYATVKATSARSSQDARVVGEVMVQTPVVLDEDEAAQTAAKMHKVAWTEADGEFQLSVPESMLAIIPSDAVGISLRGVVNRYRIEKQQHESGMLKWTLRRDRQSAYTSNVTGIPIPDPTPPPPTIVGDTVLVVAEISPRQDSEDDLHYLVAVTGANPAWYGAVVQRSLDGGASYTQAARITTAARIGELLNVVPDADEHTTDTTNTVQIRLYRDTQSLDSLTEAEFLSEGGAFLLENADGTFEVMQYLDAVTDSAGDITLSTLHRGRLNSGTSSHAIGAKFVMLEDMTHVVAQSAWIGQTLTHRAPSFEQAAELATDQDLSFLGTSQIEWPVASLVLARNVSNIVTGSWSPRYRLGTDDTPVNSANMTGYRITIVGSSTVVLPDQTANSFSYDASALGASVVVSVQALNRITGAGPATSGTI